MVITKGTLVPEARYPNTREITILINENLAHAGGAFAAIFQVKGKNKPLAPRVNKRRSLQKNVNFLSISL